ncbi:unnamed protein product [Camellia sinensis]
MYMIRRESGFAMAATTVTRERRKKWEPISLSHRPTELPSQETGRVLSARLMCSEEINRHSLSLFRRRQRSRRVEFLCSHQQPQTPSEGLPMIFIILFFFGCFLGANRITCEKKMEKIQSSTRKHRERERERERGGAVDLGGEIIGSNDL